MSTFHYSLGAVYNVHIMFDVCGLQTSPFCQTFLEPASFLNSWVMCRGTASASRWWWTRGRSCVRPTSTVWMSPMSDTLSKGSQKTSRVKLSFSQNNHISKRLRVQTPGCGWGQGFEVWQVYLSGQQGVRIWKPWSQVHYNIWDQRKLFEFILDRFYQIESH